MHSVEQGKRDLLWILSRIFYFLPFTRVKLEIFHITFSYSFLSDSVWKKTELEIIISKTQCKYCLTIGTFNSKFASNQIFHTSIFICGIPLLFFGSFTHKHMQDTFERTSQFLQFRYLWIIEFYCLFLRW